ncbi:hypothetical protein BASA81_006089 [Batrachochytrium salamandrivorans]|nr:hypothetical protein BASA81_006089 [Batrachochytrium salamandrivorans]
MLAKELSRIKLEVFGLSKPFREHQLEAMQACALGKNIFFVAATGQGKSLVYQLPSALRPPFVLERRPTIVVSPLKALIHDQLHHLKQLKVKCEALHGGIPFSAIAGGLSALDLLFVTPEQLLSSSDEEYDNPLLARLRTSPPARFVFDEAHCILHWGNSFRPKYLEAVQSVASEFPQAPISLLSATAPPTIRQDLGKLFGDRDMQVFVSQQLDRPNLSYHLRLKPGSPEALHDSVVAALRGQECAIVYCVTKDQVDSLAAVLAKAFPNQVQRYHSGLSPNKRAAGMKLWQSGLCSIMVATNAFGMGVNASSVRCIIHTAMPLSLTDYIQQCGRAGRDGLPATCILHYNVKGDVVQARKMVAEYDPQELDEMISLCVGKACVKRVLHAKVTGTEPQDGYCQTNCSCRM